jgi:hypothetical protein
VDELNLRREVAQILAAEEADVIDWQSVRTLSTELAQEARRDLNLEAPAAVYHFLEDVELRSWDPEYARRQRKIIAEYVATGRVEYPPSSLAAYLFLALIAFAVLEATFLIYSFQT